MRYIQLKSGKCVIAAREERFEKCVEKYNIQQVDSLKAERIEELLKQGFYFHDRVLRFEISVDAQKDLLKRIEIPEGVSISLSDTFTEDMYHLACEAYTTDRRFHLEQKFDSNVANDVIGAYLREFKEKNYLVIKALYQQKLLGFTVIRECEKKEVFENVLGATLPGMKGKMIAVPLYGRMLELASESAFKSKCKKYVGDVSSTNAASINLHMYFGGKVTTTIDEYIYRN